MTSDTSCTLHIIFHFDEEIEGVSEEEGVMTFLDMLRGHLPFETTAHIREPHEIEPGHNAYIAYLTQERASIH